MIKKQCPICSKEFQTPGRRNKFCSLKCGYLGRKNTGSFKKGLTPWNKGMKGLDLSKGKGQFKKGHKSPRKGKPYLEIRGKNHPKFKGIVTEKALRARIEAVNIQKEARERDGMCMVCKEAKSKLHAHHIKPWKQYPNLRYKLNNLITLCISCHSAVRGKEKNFEKLFQGLVQSR